MKRLSCLTGFLLLYASLAAGQSATVTQRVNVRPDASTSGAPLAKLQPGAQVDLVDPGATNGFFHVKTQNGTEGWAWSRNLRVGTTFAAQIVQHVGPANLYPTQGMTPGKADTLEASDITKRYTGGCPASKDSCTYSQAHRDVSGAVHTKVYDEYDVPQARRNIKDGEVDHFDPLCAGGSNDISNLWYQPAVNEWNGKNFGYHTKDKLETYICVQIKNGKLVPKDAYDRITKDWVKFYLDEGLDETD